MKTTALIAIIGVVAVLGVAGAAVASGTVANALGDATDGSGSGHMNGGHKHMFEWAWAGESDGWHDWYCPCFTAASQMARTFSGLESQGASHSVDSTYPPPGAQSSISFLQYLSTSLGVPYTSRVEGTLPNRHTLSPMISLAFFMSVFSRSRSIFPLGRPSAMWLIVLRSGVRALSQ